ncbi:MULTISPECIES: serine/threonine-protein kinase [Streptomyces]|uniref:non-specific serine/threonine protein kinase n=1 Tax=Streptomyces stelliscabiei TaxID=146820 RepID=A0A8I0P9I9_9ACTN|nr:MULTISPECIES: serine/threonine-protein kinase [Streptomyces]KND40869.1 serine/threonine protein kinase [Streptomyces stelliscabiei]MBE1597708.1 serine/threonine-protein kinase [Streptomyces stelliscabiei]MDX2519935.1 serine/threonine-protein kinase [Streptomyces stelliscabiei]MDX2556752.1 serine/threonine-protein kinase [Streptomyces stelliscabiei]MDX2615861.1 serine/threonine-protein kinase [Streptomyces stelliscabiei]
MRPVGSKYLLEEPIGRGATGTVWRARQRETAGAEAAVPGHPGETVAIKVLKEELASDADIVMRFLRERSVLLRLTHPNVVRVRDLVVEGDLLALVMDLIEGPDLHRYLRENGPFSPVGASLLTAQIADALAASHADGVVHRDLKPANVLLRQGGGEMHPMLTDFGIARLADSPGLTRTSEFVGTPAYVAPESAEGRPQTSAVDIYGAGILMYELVTGRPPFNGQSALEVLHQHLSAEPRRPSTVPDPLWTVIERCLRKNPDERPSAVNLARALRIVAEGVGVHANSMQIAAADGVGHILAPDPAPAQVPGAAPDPFGSADATQVLPHGAGAYDPNAATSVLPHTSGPAGSGDPTTVLPHTGGADPTSVMPPVPSHDSGGRPPEEPHPWQNQLRAARDRNEQTQIQQYLDPGEDPLRRRPQRQANRQQPQQQPQRPPQQPPRRQQRGAQGGPGAGYGHPQQQQPYAPAPPPPPQPQRQQPQRYAPAPQPQQPAPRPQREPRPPREPRQRSANPMRIPGLGCLKGCLFMIVLFLVGGWLIWEFTPLQSWIGTGQSWWGQLSDWVGDVGKWVRELDNGSGK